MQVNSASSYTPQSSGSLAVDNKHQVAEQRDVFRVQKTQQDIEKPEKDKKQNTQKIQEQAQEQNKKVERFDIDEKALALVEQAQFESQQAQFNQNSLQTTLNSSESGQGNSSLSGQTTNQSTNQSGSKTNFDSPPKKNQTAISAYSSVDNIAQRENIQQVFGIDLLA